MKKIYKNPSLRIIDEVVDTPLLGASNFADGQAQTGGEGGVKGGNDGDGLAKNYGLDW